MQTTPKPITRLVEAFSRLPGIGPKTASRLTFYLLRSGEELATELAGALENLHRSLTYCQVCFNISETSPCPICQDEQRKQERICVVEEPLDVLAIEKTGAYQGLYHVLHGAISPIDGIGPDELRIEELVERLQNNPVQEIILATNPSLEGEATAMYLERQIAPFKTQITRLARGLPVGGDLEYADTITLTRALEGRRKM